MEIYFPNQLGGFNCLHKICTLVKKIVPNPPKTEWDYFCLDFQEEEMSVTRVKDYADLTHGHMALLDQLSWSELKKILIRKIPANTTTVRNAIEIAKRKYPERFAQIKSEVLNKNHNSSAVIKFISKH